MKSPFPLRVERDRALTRSRGWSYPVSGRRSHEMRLSDGARNRENCGGYPPCSLAVTQLDTQDRQLDENRMLSHSRSVIVHYERESQSDAPSRPGRHVGWPGGADLSWMQRNEEARVITASASPVRADMTGSGRPSPAHPRARHQRGGMRSDDSHVQSLGLLRLGLSPARTAGRQGGRAGVPANAVNAGQARRRWPAGW